MKLGEYQTLKVHKQVEFGVYLADDEGGTVLLPGKYVPAGARVGDDIDIFLYKDSQDRLIATTLKPMLTMGEVARLRVVDVNEYGAFLYWGLEKDLFLPYKQQTARVKAGDEPLVSLYIDKSNRLCATMNVYESLRTDSEYAVDDRVKGTVYESSDNYGLFVAVDDRYSGLIPRAEIYGDICIGDRVTCRVVQVRDDGKLTLSLREKAYKQMDSDEQTIESYIRSHGPLPYSDKTVSPEIVRRDFAMSKKEFKRALGGLLKAGKIVIGEDSIRLR